ncbi:hypothetical protein MKW98_030086 [Papaver atlanticum]|uniref:Uncharacterized protein n=1 Tax=Papaver atlanticum TaxID=357466 RepID=A0AAD4T7J2_9MAGN|nr:hypothetical protein MKW98_030086 [Papaver atlanticum]
MAEIFLAFEDNFFPIHHIPGPEGVRAMVIQAIFLLDTLDKDVNTFSMRSGWLALFKKSNFKPVRLIISCAVAYGKGAMQTQKANMKLFKH